MDNAFVSAIAALTGSAIGAVSSLATTWLTQRHQDRAQLSAQQAARRERLFGDFIDQASLLFADALTHGPDDPAKLVPLYAVMNKMRLFASPPTVESANAVMQRIIDAYYAENRDVMIKPEVNGEQLDVLRTFTECCRRELWD